MHKEQASRRVHLLYHASRAGSPHHPPMTLISHRLPTIVLRSIRCFRDGQSLRRYTYRWEVAFSTCSALAYGGCDLFENIWIFSDSVPPTGAADSRDCLLPLASAAVVYWEASQGARWLFRAGLDAVRRETGCDRGKRSYPSC